MHTKYLISEDKYYISYIFNAKMYLLKRFWKPVEDSHKTDP